jgi:hypothetical protein
VIPEFRFVYDDAYAGSGKYRYVDDNRVYLPEINGGVLQCRQLINNLKGSVNFTVLAGTSSDSCDGSAYFEDILVTRIVRAD